MMVRLNTLKLLTYFTRSISKRYSLVPFSSPLGNGQPDPVVSGVCFARGPPPMMTHHLLRRHCSAGGSSAAASAVSAAETL